MAERNLATNVTIPIGEGTQVLLWIPPAILTSLSNEYSVQVAAFNEIGTGPFSSPIYVTIQGTVADIPDSFDLAWIVAGCLVVILIAVLVLLLAVRKQTSTKTSTTSRHTSGLISHPDQGIHSSIMETSTLTTSTLMNSSLTSNSLWIDRRFDQESPSTSENKQLLNNNSCGESEYTYIDRKTLSTFRCNNGISGLMDGYDPEPYATTDLLRKQAAEAAKLEVIWQIEGWVK